MYEAISKVRLTTKIVLSDASIPHIIRVHCSFSTVLLNYLLDDTQIGVKRSYF